MTDRPKRPRDANQLAKFIVDVATGEVEADSKRRVAISTGSQGGKARAKNLTKAQRSEIAKKAATARWEKTAAPDEEENS